jgi:uncharacterized protein (DUF1697 family)
MRYVVLLRGINVGGRIIPMAELKACFEKARFKNVVSILQTGNVVLDSGKGNVEMVRTGIEKLLKARFDYPARVLVITPAYLDEVIKKYPFKHGPEFHRYAVFTEGGFEKELVNLAGALDKKMEEVRAGKGVVYWGVLKGFTLKSEFGILMGKHSNKHFITNRNLNTLKKILAKC